LLALLVLDESADCASCTLDDDCDADADAAVADEAADELAANDAVCCWLCAALFCWTMLCCKVCENGIAFAAAAAAALVDWLLAELNSEPIWERSDMGNPVKPSKRKVYPGKRNPLAS
jgi:hypothetical protein